MNKNTFIDVEFSEQNSDLINEDNINSPIYYSCEQVSKIVKEPASTIRYWTKSLEEVLEVEIINTQRKYKKRDIENLLLIKKLIRVDNMSIKQVQEYFKNGKNIDKEVVDFNNPIEVKVFSRMFSDYMDDRIEQMSSRMLVKQQEMNKDIVAALYKGNNMLNIKLEETINNAIENKMAELLENNNKLLEENKNLRDNLDIILDNQNTIKKDNEEIYKLQQKLAERKEQYENNQSWFSKIKNRIK